MPTYNSNELYMELPNGGRADASLHEEMMSGVSAPMSASILLARAAGLTEEEISSLFPSVLSDEQLRAPKGSPIGGQWVKSGEGGGAIDKALNSAATGKYNAGAILALTHKDPKDLTHYEKKVVAKYKKALANEQVYESDQKAIAAKADYAQKTKVAAAAQQAAGEMAYAQAAEFKTNQQKQELEAYNAMFSKPDKVAPTVADLNAKYKAAAAAKTLTGEEAIVAYGQGKITHSEMKAAQTPKTPKVDAEFETFDTPNKTPAGAGSAATDAALNKVATAQYPAEKVKGLLSKDPKTLTHYEKKKLAAYKKALQEEGGTAAAPKKIDPNSAEAQAVFAEIGASKGMKADTVQKLATGEWAPQAGKSYQNDVQAKAKAYLETGQKPAKAVINNSKGAYGPSLAKSLTDTPPPISNPNIGQQELAGLHPLAPHEKSAAMKYTGSTHQDINSALRKGSTHALVPAIDGAMAKSYAKEPMVVVRGISSTGMQHWLSKNGGAISVGATIQDKGYASTTRKAQTASNFAGGGSGFGLKINVPKGAQILPLKSISHFANEDEFLLPRSSFFKIIGFDQNTKVISVDLVSA